MATRKTKKEEDDKKRKKLLPRIFGGEALIDFVFRHKGYLLFLLVLISFRMINGYQAEKTLMRVDDLRDSIKQLKFESLSVESSLIKLSRPSVVIKRVQDSGLDLEQPREAPGIIYVEEID